MRLTEIVVVPSDDQYERDKGKRFIVKEMPALQAEKWAWKLLLALSKAGANIDMIRGLGMAGLAMAGIQAMPSLDFEAAEPLMDEMIPHIRYVIPTGLMEWDAARPLNFAPKGDGEGDDIEEIATWILLRSAFMELHTRFFTKGARSNSTSETQPMPPDSSNAQTSREPSPQL